MKFIGDSVVVGVGASVPALSWVGLCAPVNKGLSASQAADMSRVAQEEYPPVGWETYNIGVDGNDAAKYKTDAGKQAFFKNTLRATIAWLLLTDKKTGWGPQAWITFGGTWTQSPSPCPCGKYTTQAGASASATVSGTTVWIGLSEGDYVDMSESVTVTIDGIDRGTFSVKRPGITTILGQWWGRCAWYFGGLSAGNHTVVITNNQSGKFLHLDWIAGSDQADPSLVRVGNMVKATAWRYANDGYTQSVIETYNTIIADVVAEFTANSLRVLLVDQFSVFDPVTQAADQYGHPNDVGYLGLYKAWGRVR